MQYAADHAAGGHPRLAAYIRWQVRSDLGPLLVTQPEQAGSHAGGSLEVHSERIVTSDSARDFMGLPRPCYQKSARVIAPRNDVRSVSHFPDSGYQAGLIQKLSVTPNLNAAFCSADIRDS